ncbi:MAG: DNA gyrase inhibitor YacG [Betaproteobacteria bacterium]|jgi:endogenous inhibitor of DNA gyrase (YacG/DUF329 family)
MSDRIVTCPACKGPSLYGTVNPWRPFCSRRCREHDLGAWATESYRVEDLSPNSDDSSEPAARGLHQDPGRNPGLN